MKKIEEIDKNLLVNSGLKTEGTKIYDINNEPFKIYGVTYNSKVGNYVRLEPEIAKTVNDGVKALNNHTAGGRVRFTTNSKYLGIRAILPSIGRMSHFTLAGSAGFDLYTDDGHSHASASRKAPGSCPNRLSLRERQYHAQNSESPTFRSRACEKQILLSFL